MSRKKPRVLFVLKLRQQSGGGTTTLKHSGLFNSATFVKDMLLRNGYVADLVQVVDNNSIDRHVALFRPNIVIIEALWVVPEKFDILSAKYPGVTFIIRLHSELPFLANEGIALEWINAYVEKPNLYVSANSETAFRDLNAYLKSKPGSPFKGKLIYLPNYYPVTSYARSSKSFFKQGQVFHVGCFGAIRPMKNHLVQAAAAVQFCEEQGMQCHFHVNAGRVEQKGDTVLKNLRAFFAGLGAKHQLVEHGWLDRTDFLKLLRTMHVGLQVSFSETFNIVSADLVSQNVPTVTSSEVDWMPSVFTADPVDTSSIVSAIGRACWYDRTFRWLDLPRRALQRNVNHAEVVWLTTIPKLVPIVREQRPRR